MAPTATPGGSPIEIRTARLERRWVSDIAAVLLDRQQSCGAVHDWPFGFNATGGGGPPANCNHRPPQSNAEYGTGESTMQQTGADPG